MRTVGYFYIQKEAKVWIKGLDEFLISKPF